MRIVWFFGSALPVFVLWILYRYYIKKEGTKKIKEDLYTGIFCFAFIALFYYLIS